MKTIYIITHEWSDSGDRHFSIIKSFEDKQQAITFFQQFLVDVKNQFFNHHDIDQDEKDLYNIEQDDSHFIIDCDYYESWDEVKIIETTLY